MRSITLLDGTAAATRRGCPASRYCGDRLVSSTLPRTCEAVCARSRKARANDLSSVKCLPAGHCGLAVGVFVLVGEREALEPAIALYAPCACGQRCADSREGCQARSP